jgi:hypothetical protein
MNGTMAASGYRKSYFSLHFFKRFGIRLLFTVCTIKVHGEILKTNIVGENTTSLE